MKIIKVGLGNTDEAYIESRFSDGINIIFSDDNNKGKTIVIQSIARLISIAKLTKHSCPIIMDSFRAEDLSTEKEERVLALLSELKRQCILTTTLKTEEKDKYVKMVGINAIDYTGHLSNKILGAEELPAFMKLLGGLGISLQ